MAAKSASKYTSHCKAPVYSSLHMKITLYVVVTKELMPYSMYCPALVGMIVQAHTARMLQ